jgi:ABC-type multidrug transport system permease subunit
LTILDTRARARLRLITSELSVPGSSGAYSCTAIPLALLPVWVQRFSTINPVSYLADASRALIVSGYDWSAIDRACAAIAVFGVIVNGLAVMAFRAQGK